MIVHKINLQVFLHMTLGGFAGPDAPHIGGGGERWTDEDLRITQVMLSKGRMVTANRLENGIISRIAEVLQRDREATRQVIFLKKKCGKLKYPTFVAEQEIRQCGSNSRKERRA